MVSYLELDNWGDNACAVVCVKSYPKKRWNFVTSQKHEVCCFLKYVDSSTSSLVLVTESFLVIGSGQARPGLAFA